MHQALYRKWRPKTFEDVGGQEHITSVLKNEVRSGKYSHAYLFCGSRGTGKTTCAKLLAKAVNCLSPVGGSPCGHCEACLAIENETTSDVVEMDAASNTGVDYIRDIKETVMYSPSMLKNRVYIIDEVHMLTQSAFNALLKTLEEPPSAVIFILATTEQQKIPATILSRCQKFEFRRISSDVIASRLSFISEKEGIRLTADAARMIARMSQGGMRDAISLLELCSGDGGEITVQTVRTVTGASGRDTAAGVACAVLSKDADELYGIVDACVSASKEMTVFWQELMDFYRDMLVVKTAKRPENYLDLTPDENERLRSVAESYPLPTLIRHCSLLEEAFVSMQRNGASKRLTAEMALLKMCDEKLDTYPEGLSARVSALEEKLAVLLSGAPIPEVKVPEVSFKKSVIPDKKPEEPKPAPVIKKPREGMRPLSWWMEAVKRVSQSEPWNAPWMKMAKAYESEGKLLIKASGGFAFSALDDPQMKAKIAELSAALSDSPYSVADIVVTEVSPEDIKDPIGELTDE